MTLDDIIAEWNEDSKVGVVDIDLTGARTIKHHAKYMAYLREASRLMSKYDSELKRVYSELSAYYMGHTKGPDGKIFAFRLDKGDVKVRIEGNKDYQTAKENLDEATNMVTTLKEILDALNRRGYILKTMVDYQRFKNGLS